MTTASLVIPVYNHAHLTRKCLDTVLADPPSALHEIIVVDDGSTERLAGALEDLGPRVRTLRHASNLGFAQACNTGARAATGDYVAFLNNDTLPRPGWLDAMVNYADRTPRAAVVGAKLLFPNEIVQHAGVVICQDRYPRHLYAGFPADHPAVSVCRAFQAVTAACALFRRKVFEDAGGFDPAFVNGYEDVDLCLRLGERGHEVHYCADSVVIHLESVTRGDHPAELDRNDRLYRERWGQRVRPDDVDYYLADGLLSMSFGSGAGYPARLSVSPLLAVVDGQREAEVERLLSLRSHQVFDLIKETIRLTTLLDDAQRSAQPPTSER